METKDLALLMLIPVILIGLVVYVDKSPVITGAVTKEQEQSNIIGTYSIMPSFKAKINYDLNDYNKIKELLDFIIKCAETENVDSCVKKAEDKDKSFSWSLGCDKGAEKVLYDFAEFFQDCIDSEDNNCLCRKNLEMSKEDIVKYGLSNIPQYDLELIEKSTKKIQIVFKESKIDLAYEVNIYDIPIWFPNRYIATYSKDKLLTSELIFQDRLDKNIEYRYAFPKQREIILYKNDNNPNKRKAIDFVKQEGNNLFYPNEQQIVDENKNPIDVININNCQLKPKNMYRFCVTRNDLKLMAFDAMDGQIKERPVTIKFGSYIPIPPPLPLNNIEVYDKQKDERSIIIKWDKSKKEIVKYNIYYGKSTSNIFEDKPLSGLKKREGFNKKELDLTKIKPIEINQIKLDTCEFDLKRKGCVYKTDNPDGLILEKEKPYSANDNYFYILTIEDGIDYDFSVTAMDKNGNEIDNVKYKLPVVKNKKSVDDLPINSRNIVSRVLYEDGNFIFSYDFRRAHKNIDDTDAKDFESYKVYYSKFSNLNPEQIIEKQKLLLNTPLSDLNYFFEFKFNPEKPETFKSPKIEVKDGEYYFFIVVAFDKNNNPTVNLKPSDIGIEFPLRYPII